jgi:hypothetical protein
MNVYRYRFCALCPNNRRTITYSLELTSDRTIMVEEIVAAGEAAQDLPKPYHENIADMLFEKFGGSQRLRAYHHGVEIETVRG